MECKEAQRLLDREGRVDKAGAGSALAEHLETCNDCRDYRIEKALLAGLASLPSPDPEPGFEQRVLNGVFAQDGNRRVHTRWALATAASVILAVFLTLQFIPNGQPALDTGQAVTATVSLEPGRTRVVDVRLNSASALENALITVRLDENVELEGYEGVSDLAWRTSVKSGDNRLSLPVRLLDDSPATVTVVLEHGGATREFTIRLEAAPTVSQSRTLGLA